MTEKSKLILASGSPRRQQLLREAGFEYDILKLDVPEDFPAHMTPEDVPLYLAKRKSDVAVAHCKNDFLLITADTVVVMKDQILNKPQNEEEATEMLTMLSGSTHKVMTGVCLNDGRKQKTFATTTLVTFANLTSGEIEFYIREYKPFDKAGAYGIQEWIGLRCISRLEGSYFNVVGLPVHELYQELKNWEQESNP